MKIQFPEFETKIKQYFGAQDRIAKISIQNESITIRLIDEFGSEESLFHDDLYKLMVEDNYADLDKNNIYCVVCEEKIIDCSNMDHFHIWSKEAPDKCVTYHWVCAIKEGKHEELDIVLSKISFMFS